MKNKINIFYIIRDDVLNNLYDMLVGYGYNKIEQICNPSFLKMKGHKIWVTIEKDGECVPFFDGTLSGVVFGLRRNPVPMFTKKEKLNKYTKT